MSDKAYIIKGSECGRDENGNFVCTCGKCGESSTVEVTAPKQEFIYGRDADGKFVCFNGKTEFKEVIREKQPLTIKTNGIRGQVLKNGIDITNGIKAVHIELVAGKLPEITIEMIDSDIELSINECILKVKQPHPKDVTV